ncbi:hypothetical protein [Methylobrevis albus]|uniref:Uncharacterized protein n=1 Tax=Methylobrevis albus TaxID=2793297 RepID=A0A931I611_9HYPH|nr:hypothetical protein [Methylobrevis albus]MBH0239926.1 hypothetical protein [Methylobrevis albus]
MLLSAIGTAFSGMRAAEQRFEKAAGEIARIGTDDPVALPHDETIAAGSPLLYGPDGRFLTSPNPAEPVDITGALGDILEARIAYMANAKVVEVASDMFDSLLDATA